MPEFDEGFTEISFDPEPDAQTLIAHIALKSGLTKPEIVSGKILEEYSDKGWLYFYYKGEKITTHERAQELNIVELTLKRKIRINL